MSVREPYGLAPSFERALAAMLSTKPKLFGAIGRAIELDLLADASAKLLIRSAQAIAAEYGKGPSAASVAVQRLKRWQDDGTVTQMQVDDAIDLLEEELSSTLPTESDVLGEMVPLLRRRMQGQIVRAAIDEYGKRGDFEAVEKLLKDAARVGTRDTDMGTRLGPESFAEIAKLRHLDRLGTGIDELDIGLGGGLPRGNVGLWIGSTGGGKSMGLTHTGGFALVNGLFVVEATLELSEAVQLARLKANLTGVPTDRILEQEDKEMREAFDALYPILGTFVVKHFTPKITTMHDIREWVTECEDVEGRDVDVLLLDYVDRMGSANKNDRNEYASQGTAMQEFRDYVEATGKWGWTGSQSQRRQRKERAQRLEAEDVADSMNKSRIADLVITINPVPDGGSNNYYVAKNRHGRGLFSIDNVPHDFACGRMLPGKVAL